MAQFSKLDKIFIALTVIFGGLILFFPIQKLLIIFLGLAVLSFLFLNPKYCYYLLVLTIPLVGRLRMFPISFSFNDLMVALCFFATIFQILVKDQKINFKTKLDKWIIVLTVLYFFAGITSEGDTGLLTSFKFLEAIISYYLTVYFIRTKEISVSKIIKSIFLSALIQAVIGLFQSLTGIGTNFQSARGYWGYFGLGSNLVWHGMGTMDHFNMLGNYLITILLFSIPITYYLIKKKKNGKFINFTLFAGVITTYSRGSLIGLFFGYLYFLFATMKNKIKFAFILTSSLIIICFLKNYLSDTSYVETLSPRNDIWNGVIASILSSPKYLWLGAGLNSYEKIVYPFLPQNNTMWFAHDFYLLCVQEMGIIGAVIIFSFLIFVMLDTFFQFKKTSKYLKPLNLSVSLSVFSIFFISIFDHAYALTFFKILLFVMMGIVYAKDKRCLKTSF